MIRSSACPPWHADHPGQAGEHGDQRRQLHHSTGHESATRCSRYVQVWTPALAKHSASSSPWPWGEERYGVRRAQRGAKRQHLRWVQPEITARIAGGCGVGFLRRRAKTDAEMNSAYRGGTTRPRSILLPRRASPKRGRPAKPQSESRLTRFDKLIGGTGPPPGV